MQERPLAQIEVRYHVGDADYASEKAALAALDKHNKTILIEDLIDDAFKQGIPAGKCAVSHFIYDNAEKICSILGKVKG